MKNYLTKKLNIKLENILSKEICEEIIQNYGEFHLINPIETTKDKLIDEYKDIVFCGSVDKTLKEYYNEDYTVFWATYDRIDKQGNKNYNSSFWHLDGGGDKMLKLFIYLTSSKDDGGNTVMIDEKRTKLLAKENAFIKEVSEERVSDLTPFFKKLNLDESIIEYDLDIGDGFIFAPTRLGHKAVPPKEDKIRHTISFTIFPNSFFGK